MHRNKVVHILYSGLGGHGNVFFSLVDADKNNFFSYSAAFCGVEPLLEEYKIKCERKEIPYRYFTKKAGLDLNIYKRLFYYFKETKPDFIFLHGASFLIPALIRKIFNPSLVIITRDTQAHHLKGMMEWFWLGSAIVFSSRIVFLTEESRSFAKKKLWFLPWNRKLVVISNGIDTDKYRPAVTGSDKSVFVIGMQSRLQRIKDHPTLLKAFKILQTSLPERKILLRIAGDGETKESLVTYCSELGILQDVEFTGLLNQDALLNFLHSLDIYVHASFGETLSNSIMQAMACGLPVIASDVWGVNNMISNEKNGLLYPSENFKDLALLMEKLINDETLCNSLGHAARQFAVSHYSSERMFLDYKRIFEKK